MSLAGRIERIVPATPITLGLAPAQGRRWSQWSADSAITLAGETIHTENSHKFDLRGLTAMVEESGWAIAQQWISDAPLYALVLLHC